MSNRKPNDAAGTEAGLAFQAYQFHNPGRARLRVSTPDEPLTCDTSGAVWTWHAHGSRCQITWSDFMLPLPLAEICKAFIFYRLQSRAPITVAKDAVFIQLLAKLPQISEFPWDEKCILTIFAVLRAKDPVLAILLRVFYLWCLETGKPGFSQTTYFALQESVVNRPNAYQNIFLHQDYLGPEDELLILKRLQASADTEDRVGLQRNILLHLCFELAPRPSQIYALDAADYEIVTAPAPPTAEAPAARYCSLLLPMTKKHSLGPIERRRRQISADLAAKIEHLISLNAINFVDKSGALFVGGDGQRLSAAGLVQQIRNEMILIGISPGATKLRHHLGQGLADQGAPADVIAEALGHNSTVAARAYIAATPAIAAIKTRALGKNKTYQRLMQAMLTGEIAEKAMTPKDRWVRGVVHLQYIQGIGGCDLAPEFSCPKNPIYSCYSCSDFHPFADGPHQEVKAALQDQAQLFLDVAVTAKEIGHTRVPLQLELTLEAVDAVIQRCERDLPKS